MIGAFFLKYSTEFVENSFLSFKELLYNFKIFSARSFEFSASPEKPELDSIIISLPMPSRDPILEQCPMQARYTIL